MPVVFISSPNCAGQGLFPVHYEATLFSVGASGVYTLDLTSTGGFASFYLYAGSFDPANGMANCVAADNFAPEQITYNLVQNSTYYVVVIDDGFAQSGGSYTVQFSGPGDIYIGNAGGPGCDVLMPIPSTAVVGSFVADAPV
ncbi:MAG: PPC domain-containing protein, partial [Aggregatilineaceae bacterium]